MTVRLMAADSDLIVVGTILSHHRAGRIDEYQVRPLRSIKNLVIDDFTVRAERSGAGGSETGAFSRELKAGTSWFLFLVQKAGVFVPTAGDNGALRLDDGRLYRMDGSASGRTPASLEEAARRFERAPYDPLLWSPLIVRGFVEECGTRRVPQSEFYPGRPDLGSANPPGALYAVYFVRVRVVETLRGSVSGPTVELDNTQNNYCSLLPLQHEVIVCASFNPVILGGSYATGDQYGFFGRDGNVWIPGVRRSQEAPPPAAHYPHYPEMTDAQLRARIAQVGLPAVTREADLIVTGDVVAAIDGDRATQVTLRVADLLKGTAADSVAFLTGGGWHYGRPDSRLGPAPKPGERWVAFLKMGTAGYFAFAGCNGLMRVDGERLIYGYVDCGSSMSELKDIVRDNVGTTR
ncbi:MAG: hypothetical protein OEV86_16135 [Candidatus Krumholzibacteria bacterium]|nr:hypothetical protein [Candidatus Krumholzibacteria bacterium]